MNMEHEEYYIITPTEVTGLKVFPIVFVIGIIILWLSDVLDLSGIVDAIFPAVAFIMIGLGIVGFAVFGILALISYKDHSRFRYIRKIAVSGEGITLIKRNGTTERSIPWQSIDKVEMRGVISSFMGLVETDREPLGIILYLVDGSQFQIPVYLILKKRDRFRMVSEVFSRLSAQDIQFNEN